MKRKILLCIILFSFVIPSLKAQDKPVTPTLIGSGVFTGETRPLRDLPAITPEEYQIMKEKADKKLLNKKLRERSYPYSENALPKGPDAVWQKAMGGQESSKAPIVNFSGQTSPYYPPDCNGAVGPNHFMQTINTTYAIYSKTGTLLAGPTNMNLLFGTVTGSGCNDGDPLVLYDEQASRWLAIEFSICGANDYMLIAVSTTSDPTGTWYKYSFDVADMPDYEKFGIWQDGYYMGDNNSTGNDIYVFQRSVMLTGGISPGMVAFNNPNRPTSIDGFMCVPPVDNDGTFAPTGAPGTFIAFNDDAIGGGSDQLWIFELAVNWTTPASSTFSRVQQLAVSAFDSNFGNDWTNIAQPGTTQQLDAIPQVVMNVPQYRNFGTYQTIVCCHSVDVNATDRAGVRWYELRRGTQISGNWAVRQQGTYSPDVNSRWMGSISLNGSGNLGLGYSISSSTVYPGIRYTGQSASAYSAANGTMDIAEAVIQTGSYSQTGAERWGDYSAISIDPVDNQTFWFTSQYVGSGDSHPTKIASFKFSSPPVVTTLAASAVTATAATLNGTVNPSGLATTYYFEWGTTTSYGNISTSTSAGSGTSAVAVNLGIGSLVSGTPYHFRLVATNSSGTSVGSDLQFTTTVVPILGVSPLNQNVTAPAGSTSFTVTSNSSWTAGSDQGWCTVTLSGTGNGAITANYTENTTFATRVANVTVTVTGLAPVIVTVTQAGALPSEFLLTAKNIIQTSATTLEFDVYLLDVDASAPFELASTQLGFFLNPGVFAGGSLTASLVAGTSELLTPQVPTATPGIVYPVSGYPGCLLRLAGRVPPGAGSGTIISTVGSGTRIIRIKLTSSVPFATNSLLSMIFTSSTAITPVYATRVAQYVGTVNTQLAVTPDYNAIVSPYPGPILNPPPTLSVNPPNRDVSSPSGSTTYDVTSNAGWTATSNQGWCTPSPSGFGNGTITASYAENTTSVARVAEITVTVTGLNPIVVTLTQDGMANKVLNLNLLLQSLYNGNGTMHPANDELGAHWGSNIADKITVELHDNSNYSTVYYTVPDADLYTNGTATMAIPALYSGSYYITVKNRNSIETVSAIPVSFSGNPVVYSFNLATQAYGNNLGLMIDGWWVIYGGDVSQDGGVDTGDMSPVDNDSFNYMSGYLVSDTNGDGIIDTGDMTIVDNNATNYVFAIHP